MERWFLHHVVLYLFHRFLRYCDLFRRLFRLHVQRNNVGFFRRFGLRTWWYFRRCGGKLPTRFTRDAVKIVHTATRRILGFLPAVGQDDGLCLCRWLFLGSAGLGGYLVHVVRFGVTTGRGMNFVGFHSIGFYGFLIGERQEQVVRVGGFFHRRRHGPAALTRGGIVVIGLVCIGILASQPTVGQCSRWFRLVGFLFHRSLNLFVCFGIVIMILAHGRAVCGQIILKHFRTVGNHGFVDTGGSQGLRGIGGACGWLRG